jgi:NAD(P)-dependent dehydrogenase (short-subunit alcohol dehydrogenase family)
VLTPRGYSGANPNARTDSRRLLAGKAAIVTGASRGIGAATARAFAGAGAAVALAARSQPEIHALATEIADAGGEAVAVATDVTDPAGVPRPVQRTLTAYGRLDVAFNDAGDGHMPTPLAERHPMVTSNEYTQAMTTHEIEQALEEFADAQVRSDSAALAQLVTDDFKLVGPLGFVVSREQWLEQFDTHALQIESLDWGELDIRTYGYREMAIAIGRLAQTATYSGTPAGGQFRVTAVALRDGPHWRLAGAHFSRIADPPTPE